jgi:hypothetical protein
MSRLFWLKAATSAGIAFVAAAAFAAYLKPEMLVQFANLVLCN